MFIPINDKRTVCPYSRQARISVAEKGYSEVMAAPVTIERISILPPWMSSIFWTWAGISAKSWWDVPCPVRQMFKIREGPRDYLACIDANGATQGSRLGPNNGWFWRPNPTNTPVLNGYELDPPTWTGRVQIISAQGNSVSFDKSKGFVTVAVECGCDLRTHIECGSESMNDPEYCCASCATHSSNLAGIASEIKTITDRIKAKL